MANEGPRGSYYCGVEQLQIWVAKLLNRIRNVMSTDKHLSELFTHASAAFIVKVAAAGLSLGLSIALAQLLGAEQTGIYYLIFTVVSIFALITRSGIDRAGLRFVSANNTSAEYANIRVVRLQCALTVLVASSFAAATVVISSDYIAFEIFRKGSIANLMAIAAIAIVPVAQFNLHAELLKGLKQTTGAITVQSALLPGLTLIGVLVLAPVHGLAGAIAALVVSSVITLIVSIVIWQRRIPSVAPGSAASFHYGKLIAASGPLFLVGLFQLIILHTATVVLGIYGEGEDIARFAIASRLAALMSFVLFAVNSIAAPKFAEFYQNDDIEQIEKTAVNSSVLMAAMATPILLVFLFGAKPVLSVYGAAFVEADRMLVILACGQFVNVITGSVAYLLAMTSNEMLLMKALAVTAIFHLLSSFMIIPYWGANGAAVVTALTMSIINLLLVYAVWKKLNIVSIPLIRKLFRAR